MQCFLWRPVTVIWWYGRKEVSLFVYDVTRRSLVYSYVVRFYMMVDATQKCLDTYIFQM